MSPFLILPLLILGACAASPSSPPILRSLDELPAGTTPRLFLGTSQAPRWVIPIALQELPELVSRTADVVQKGGALQYLGKVYGGPEDAYLIETLYPEIAENHLRRLIIDVEGSILLRSHCLSIDDLPRDLADRIATQGKLELCEFVENGGVRYYRVTLLEADGIRRVRSYTTEGDALWDARVLSVQTSVSL